MSRLLVGSAGTVSGTMVAGCTILSGVVAGWGRGNLWARSLETALAVRELSVLPGESN